MTTSNIPYIPDNAPFTPAQRAWLNGFLGGLFSAGQAPATAPAPAKISANVYFGSESGNGESFSRRAAKELVRRGFEARAIGLDKITAASLASLDYALIVTSTFGDGEPPANAQVFHAELFGEGQPRLQGLKYSVLALGDHNYGQFCKCGVDFDERLAALGATRIFARTDCDVDYEAAAEGWLNGVMEVLSAEATTAAPVPAGAVMEPGLFSGTSTSQQGTPGVAGTAAIKGEGPAEAGHGAPATPWSRKNPFPARLVSNRLLTAPGSGKETRHFEISLEGSGLTYEVGDALGVIPQNCPELVNDLLRALNRDGEEAVPGPNGGEMSLRTSLLRHYEIAKIPTSLLKAIAERSPDRTLADLMVPTAREALNHYLWGREVIDLLVDFASVTFTPQEFVGHLKKLQPRLYSISSSLHAFPGHVHLTVAQLRYESFGRRRKGICSTFLSDRANGEVPVFVQVSHAFRLPKDGAVPIIMVGPGTGVAPFRAFLHDRRARGAPGRNWLFFGEQQAATDFFYREELDSMLSDGHLTKLTTAFSRDQAEKIYVQNRMLENGADLWTWLEEGAHFYVCGDAKRMAKDVDAALHQICVTHGGLSEEGAADYVTKLKGNKRYQRDVY